MSAPSLEESILEALEGYGLQVEDVETTGPDYMLAVSNGWGGTCT